MDQHQHGKADITDVASNRAAPPSDDPLSRANAAHLPSVEASSIAPEGHGVSASWEAAGRGETTQHARSSATKAIDGNRTLILTTAKPREDFAAFEEAAPANGGASRAWRRLALPAVSLMVAVACGAAAGAAGIMSLGWATPIFSQAAPAPAIANLPSTIEEMRSDITALKASVDAAGRSNSAQFAKLTERFDRLERSQTVTLNKTDAAIAKETTGSITVPASAAAAQPVPPAPVPQPVIVPGWGVREVYRGIALLQSRAGGMVEVEAGDVLPGLGRIEAVRREGGRWVVVTSRGMIMSLR
jgi:hypothetical protein